MKKKKILIICSTIICFCGLTFLTISTYNYKKIKNSNIKKINTNYKKDDILLKNTKISKTKDIAKTSPEENLIFLKNKLIQNNNEKKDKLQVCLTYDKFVKINSKNYHKLHYYKYDKINHRQIHINWFFIEDSTKNIYELDSSMNILRKINI